MSGIGILNEKALHAALKVWYAQPGDRFEVPVDRFVIDIVRDDLLVEIQTGNFARIRAKLASLLRYHQLRLIYPIAVEKWIVRVRNDHRPTAGRRKSPKRGRIEDLFWEAVSIPRLMSNRNFSLEVLMIREEQVRRETGKRTWRRKGWILEERRLLEVVGRTLYEKPGDWLRFLPEGLETFTARDLAETRGVRLELAQKIAYSLREAKLIELVGNRGRANLYGIADA